MSANWSQLEPYTLPLFGADLGDLETATFRHWPSLPHSTLGTWWLVPGRSSGLHHQAALLVLLGLWDGGCHAWWGCVCELLGCTRQVLAGPDRNI